MMSRAGKPGDVHRLRLARREQARVGMDVDRVLPLTEQRGDREQLLHRAQRHGRLYLHALEPAFQRPRDGSDAFLLARIIRICGIVPEKREDAIRILFREAGDSNVIRLPGEPEILEDLEVRILDLLGQLRRVLSHHVPEVRLHVQRVHDGRVDAVVVHIVDDRLPLREEDARVVHVRVDDLEAVPHGCSPFLRCSAEKD
jgi:hypothetical protein